MLYGGKLVHSTLCMIRNMSSTFGDACWIFPVMMMNHAQGMPVVSVIFRHKCLAPREMHFFPYTILYLIASPHPQKVLIPGEICISFPAPYTALPTHRRFWGHAVIL